MRKGDLLRCRFNFEFSSVNEEDLLTIMIKRGETKDYILIPLYISGLGFFQPQFDYVLPGSYLPPQHPDYYRTVGDKFIYNGQQSKMSCDKEFMYNGKYYLMPETSGSVVTKTAQLRSKEHRKDMIEKSIGRIFEGELLEGIALEFLLRNQEDNSLRGVINSTEPSPVGATNPKVMALLRDPITFVEYEFPVLYLKNK